MRYQKTALFVVDFLTSRSLRSDFSAIRFEIDPFYLFILVKFYCNLRDLLGLRVISVKTNYNGRSVKTLPPPPNSARPISSVNCSSTVVIEDIIPSSGMDYFEDHNQSPPCLVQWYWFKLSVGFATTEGCAPSSAPDMWRNHHEISTMVPTTNNQAENTCLTHSPRANAPVVSEKCIQFGQLESNMEISAEDWYSCLSRGYCRYLFSRKEALV